MAYPAQNVTKTKVATGHLILRIRDNSACTGASQMAVEIGRITEVTDIETGETLYEHKGYNASGAKQNVAIFPTEKGSGRYRLTLDEVPDIDGLTWDGEQVDVAIKQQFKKATDKAWRMLAAKAYIKNVSLKPAMDTPTTLQVEVIPYNTPGTPAWEFDDNYSVA